MMEVCFLVLFQKTMLHLFPRSQSNEHQLHVYEVHLIQGRIVFVTAVLCTIILDVILQVDYFMLVAKTQSQWESRG